jgi:hypothetical protein
VVEGARVTADLKFSFKDGSTYEETTVFSQGGHFRVLRDHVAQKGPAFKQEMESWINAVTGEITVHSVENGKDKTTNKHLDLPPDVSNGLTFTLVKNIKPETPRTTVSMVAASSSPRVVKLNILPQDEKSFSVGILTLKAQRYVVKVEIPGVAGIVVPVIGKRPPDMHVSVLKSEAPSFIAFEGPLYEDGPIWRIELTNPTTRIKVNPSAPRAHLQPNSGSSFRTEQARFLLPSTSSRKRPACAERNLSSFEAGTQFASASRDFHCP